MGRIFFLFRCSAEYIYIFLFLYFFSVFSFLQRCKNFFSICAACFFSSSESTSRNSVFQNPPPPPHCQKLNGRPLSKRTFYKPTYSSFFLCVSFCTFFLPLLFLCNNFLYCPAHPVKKLKWSRRGLYSGLGVNKQD